MDSMCLENKKILIISPEPWGKIRLSKHHYAEQLSEKNSVFYLNPFSNSESIQKINHGLSVIDYKGIKGLNRLPSIVRTYFQKKLIQKIIKICKVESFDLVWSFDPYSFQNQKLWNAPISIYHAMDHHKTDLEKYIVSSSDFTFAPSDLILNKFKGIKSKQWLHKINHGLADVFCISKTNKTQNNPLKIGYVGNLTSQSIRLDLLLKIIVEHSSIEFILIGPLGRSNISAQEFDAATAQKVIQLDNVKHLGPLAPEAYHNEIEQLDGFIVCYDSDPISISNSHKILEYLSTGKVIFSGPIDEYLRYPELVISASKIESLPTLFSKEIIRIDSHNTIVSQQKRIAYAQNNTYSKQVKRIEQILSHHLSN
jgi:hypothetical protein